MLEYSLIIVLGRISPKTKIINAIGKKTMFSCKKIIFINNLN